MSAKRAATILSILFDSSLLAIPIFIGVAWAETNSLWPTLGWASLALLFADGIPLSYLLIGQRFGWVSGYELPKREERAPFIAVNLIGNGIGYILLRLLSAPDKVAALLLVYVALAAVMMTISSFWKISLHAGGVGGFAAALSLLFGPPWLLSFLALPVIGWARVAKGRHSWPQVLAGGLAGSLVTTAVLALTLT